MESKFGIGDTVAANVLGWVAIFGTIVKIREERKGLFSYDIFSKDTHMIYKYIPEDRIVLCESAGETIVDIINQ